MKFAGKWVELEKEQNFLIEVTQTNKDQMWYILTYKWVLAMK